MTFEDIVGMVRDVYENADARNVFEHAAIQINIEGEAEGVFYIEIADRKVSVEPYDYHDKDALVVTSAQAIFDISDGRHSWKEAKELGLVKLSGDMRKLALYNEIIFKKVH